MRLVFVSLFVGLTLLSLPAAATSNAGSAIADLFGEETAGEQPSVDTPAYFRKKGYDLMREQRMKEAAQMFTKWVDKEPANAKSHHALALALDHSGNHKAAQESYGRALEYDPTSVAIKNNLALSYIMNKQTDEATTLLEELHKIAPNHQAVRYNLALAYGLTGRSDKVRGLIGKYLKPQELEQNLAFYKTLAEQKNIAQVSTPKTEEKLPAKETVKPAAEPTPKEEKTTIATEEKPKKTTKAKKKTDKKLAEPTHVKEEKNWYDIGISDAINNIEVKREYPSRQ